MRLGRNSEPVGDLVPVHPPDAVQALAFVLVQLSVEEPPLVTVVGVAFSDTVGGVGPAATVTVTDCAAVPPAPVQVSVKSSLQRARTGPRSRLESCSLSIRPMPYRQLH